MRMDVRENAEFVYFLALDGERLLNGVIWVDTDTGDYGVMASSNEGDLAEDYSAPLLVNRRPVIAKRRGENLRVAWVDPAYWIHPFKH